MNTPEEIKKGLECRARAYNGACTYTCSSCDTYVDGRFSEIFRKALVYIQRLEETIGSLKLLNKTMHDEAKNGIQELESRLAQTERERDALWNDMHKLQGALCAYCDNLFRDHSIERMSCKVFGNEYGGEDGAPLMCGRFKWRGVCPENTKED